MLKRRLAATCLVIAALVATADAAERRTEYTWALEPGEARPAATLEDAAWLAGTWSGTAFGSRFEEVWNPPSAGSMVGMFKLLGDEGVAFYELMTITIEDGTLSLRVRHFDADFTAWEDKDEHLDFKLVKKEADALHFGGLSFYRRDADTIDGYIAIRTDDGIVERHLALRRLPRSECPD